MTQDQDAAPVASNDGIDTRAISYSINAEDILLQRIFAGRRTGFFVDVGAEDPVYGNDFFGLYQVGWRGINIEPNPAYFALLQQKRPEDLNLQLLVSDTPSEALPFYIVEGTGLSTCDADMAANHAARQADVHRVYMQAVTLAQVLEQARVSSIDVLKIDVEGFEEKVLRGNDWDRFRPLVIMLEVTFPQSAVRRETGITEYLEGNGYKFAYHDGLNDFFFEKSFNPPPKSMRASNVFDNVVRWEMIALRNNYDALRSGFVDVEQYAKALEEERDSVGKVLTTTKATLIHEQRRRQEVAAVLETTQRVAIDLLTNGYEGVDMILGGTGQIPDADGRVVQGAAIETGRELMVLQNHDALWQEGDIMAADHLSMLKARLGSLQRERNTLVQQVKDLEIQNRRLALGNEQLQGERLALHRALDGEKAHSHILSEARRALKELRSLVADERATWPEKANNSATRLEQANAEAARIERDGDVAMIKALYSSTSWKLTRPVRALGRLFGTRKS